MKLGIDFGTCFSFVATKIGSDVKLLTDGILNDGVPSLFIHTKDQDYFGSVAREKQKDFPQDCIKEIKKVIREDRKWIVQDSTETFSSGGKKYKAEEIVELIIKNLIETAKQKAKMQGIAGCDAIEEITIAAPVGLDRNGRVEDATALYNEMLIRVAKKVTGIRDDSRVHIIGEPVAAAMYNLYKRKSEGKQTILVYDLGGGTFDSAIVKYDPNAKTREKYEVIATGGYTSVGGGEWNKCLAEIVREKEKLPKGYVPENPRDRLSFESGIEDAKIFLSSHDSAVVDYNAGGIPRHPLVLRKEFEAATVDYLDLTMGRVDTTLMAYERQKKRRSDLSSDKIDRLVLVGGASQMPQVKRRLLEKFPQFDENSIYLDDPHVAIAAGAAINNDISIGQVVLHTYGVECHQRSTGRNRISNIIYKGTPIYGEYAAAEKKYHPLSNIQLSTRVNAYISDVLEGEDEIDDDKYGWIDFEVGKKLFGYEVPVPTEYAGRATEYGMIAEFRITKNGTIELRTYEEQKDGSKGKLIKHERYPKESSPTK